MFSGRRSSRDCTGGSISVSPERWQWRYCIRPAIPLLLGYLGVLDARTPGLLVILIVFSLLQHLPYSLMTTTVLSAFADIADENELRFGARQQGILYSTQTFFSCIDQAVGSALAGWTLTLIAFPKNAVPGHVGHSTLSGLALAFILSTVPGLPTAFFYGRLRLTRATHAATRQALQSLGRA